MNFDQSINLEIFFLKVIFTELDISRRIKAVKDV